MPAFYDAADEWQLGAADWRHAGLPDDVGGAWLGLLLLPLASAVALDFVLVRMASSGRVLRFHWAHVRIGRGSATCTVSVPLPPSSSPNVMSGLAGRVGCGPSRRWTRDT